jgi:hypothetical protein
MPDAMIRVTIPMLRDTKRTRIPINKDTRFERLIASPFRAVYSIIIGIIPPAARVCLNAGRQYLLKSTENHKV